MTMEDGAVEAASTPEEQQGINPTSTPEEEQPKRSPDEEALIQDAKEFLPDVVVTPPEEEVWVASQARVSLVFTSEEPRWWAQEAEEEWAGYDEEEEEEGEDREEQSPKEQAPQSLSPPPPQPRGPWG